MKAVRQRKIIELIKKFDIETQEELAKYLIAEGFHVTQATVSRDIKELVLTKTVSDNGKQKYTLNQNADIANNNKYILILKESVIKMDCAGNLLVVGTIPGTAMAVGAALDAMAFGEILGTIAGDDTVMCAVKNISDTPLVKEKLERIIGR